MSRLSTLEEYWRAAHGHVLRAGSRAIGALKQQVQGAEQEAYPSFHPALAVVFLLTDGGIVAHAYAGEGAMVNDENVLNTIVTSLGSIVSGGLTSAKEAASARALSFSAGRSGVLGHAETCAQCREAFVPLLSTARQEPGAAPWRVAMEAFGQALCIEGRKLAASVDPVTYIAPFGEEQKEE